MDLPLCAGGGRRRDPRCSASASARFQAGLLASGSTLVSFVCALVAFVGLLGEHPEERAHSSTPCGPGSPPEYPLRRPDPGRPALGLHEVLVVSGVGFLISPAPSVTCTGDAEGAPLSRPQGAFRLLDAPPRAGGEPASPPRGLGHSRPLLLSPHQFLAPPGERRGSGQEGLRHERLRRRDHRSRALPAHPARGLAGLPRRLHPEAIPEGHGCDPDRPRPLGGAVAKSAQVPLHTLAARRDGGPDPVSTR